ncbi:Phosphoric monoester hydrolase [Sarracenia purpurea var. burkii]
MGNLEAWGLVDNVTDDLDLAPIVEADDVDERLRAHGISHLVLPTRDYLFAPSLNDICQAVDFIHGLCFQLMHNITWE